MANAQPEPSMEEILASIRRIISEDDEQELSVDRSSLDSGEPDTPSSVAPKVTPTPVTPKAESVAVDKVNTVAPAPAPAPVTNQPVAPSLTSSNTSKEEPTALAKTVESTVVQEVKSAVTQVGSISDTSETQQPELPKTQAKDEYQTKDVKMVKQQATAVKDDTLVDSDTADAAVQAFGNLSRSVKVADEPGQSLEQIVTGMLKPMVKEWLDANLPRIVEEKVEYEVQRLARRG